MIPLKTPNSNEITYLEADINYTIFHLKNGQKIVSSFTLKKYEADSNLVGFLRVHKSFLLNPDFIKQYEQHGKKATILLSNGRTVDVSRRKINLVKSFLMPKISAN
jgi:DNA-binding LytR/AlgR family response regulator